MKLKRRPRGLKLERLCVDVLPETNDLLAKLAIQNRVGIGIVLDNLAEHFKSTITGENSLPSTPE